jgi:glutamine synthetase
MSFATRCGAQDAARASACAAVLQRVREEGITQVRVAWADLHGSFRGKTVVCDGGALESALEGGIGLVSTVLLKDTSDRTAFKVFDEGGMAGLPGFGAANNLLLLPEPASFAVLPWAPHTGWLRAEPRWPDGSVVAVDPRRVLQRALAELQAQGYGLQCGLEVEFHVLRIESDGLATAAAAWPPEPPTLRHLHPGYKLLAEDHADMADEVMGIVRRTSLALGLPLRSLEIELGPSQLEAVFAPTDALAAADQMMMFRNATRQALRRAGYHASFVCRLPLPETIASGWHLHQSLVDGEGRNAMTPGEAGQDLSPAGLHWLAGLLAHAPALVAICAPSIPAYARYRGSVMAPQAAVWGRDNRGAMLRVLGGAGDAATRIENRIGEPLANPYLTIAAQIFAGLHGLREQLQAPPATEKPYAPAHTALPATLADALDALAADSVLQRDLGVPMTQVYTAIKRQELARHAQADDQAQWERREYFGRF